MLTELVIQYGYLMVVAGVIVEGDATLVTASFLAHRGYLALSAVMALAALTSATMNQIYFRLGRRHGVERVAKAEGKPLFATILRHTRKHALWLVLVSRFIFGFRMAIPMTVGALGLGAVRFLFADICGAILWSVVIGSTGYAAGRVVELLLTDIKGNEWTVALVLCALMVAWTIYRRRHVQQINTLLDRTDSLV
jgi:membrane protein DedA with SNARE-associated domain